MIQKDLNIELLTDIFSRYKKNYEPIINEYVHVYTYNLDGKIVAFLIFSVLYDKCEVIDIFVDEEYRNNKIAQKLINQILIDFDIDNITLEVSEKNVNAIKLYEKLDFKKVATRKNYYEDCDGILMLKEVR